MSHIYVGAICNIYVVLVRDAIVRKQKVKKRKSLSGYAELIFQIFGPRYSRLSNLCIKKLKF